MSGQELNQQGSGVIMRSRHDFVARDLAQTWRACPLPSSGTMLDERIDATVYSAHLYWLRDYGVLALEVEVATVPDENEILEKGLTGLAETYAERYLPVAYRSLAWVGRTVLSAAEEPQIDGWLGPNPQSVLLHDAAGKTPAEATVSWGNSAITGWDDLDETSAVETVRGMVDAQALWREISHIAERAAERARDDLIGRRSAVRQRELRRFLRDLEELTAQMADHNLASDEQMLNIQGNRKAAGLAWLQSWDYPDMVARIERRLHSLESVAGRKRERLNARFQGSVQTILLVLGVAAVIDMALSVVSTAFAGNAETTPGETVPWGFFAFVRNSGGEPLLLIAVVLVGLIAVWLIRSRKAK